MWIDRAVCAIMILRELAMARQSGIMNSSPNNDLLTYEHALVFYFFIEL